jgi:peptidoglycan/xylan/chitin deacetylase (PgdA/CDA1 family)
VLKKVIRATGLRRAHVAAGRMFLERQWLARKGIRPTRPRPTGRILCYHSVGQLESGVNNVEPRRFRRQIELALRAGFRFVTASRIAQAESGPLDLAITFDDGWKSVLSNAAPILRDYNIPWSLFVVTSWCDHRSSWTRQNILPWKDIEHLAAHGATIGSHSLTHPDFALIDRYQMTDELRRSREIIRQRLGLMPTEFAIPYGQSMNWPHAAGEIALTVGYDVVYAQAERTRPKDTAPRTFVTCFDGDRIFNALLRGAYDDWEEWV